MNLLFLFQASFFFFMCLGFFWQNYLRPFVLLSFPLFLIFILPSPSSVVLSGCLLPRSLPPSRNRFCPSASSPVLHQNPIQNTVLFDFVPFLQRPLFTIRSDFYECSRALSWHRSDFSVATKLACRVRPGPRPRRPTPWQSGLVVICLS